MRRKLVHFHVWLALIFGVLWALQGLTGGLIVFMREFDRAAAPAFTPGPMKSIDDIIAGAQVAADGAFIHRLSISDGERHLIYALYQDRAGVARSVVMDPATAQPLEVREWAPRTPFHGEITRWLYWLHSTLLAGDNGKTLAGLLAIGLMVATIIGLWIAWPPRSAWKFVFAADRWRNTEQRLYGWHRAVGLTLGLVLVPVVAAGAYLALPHEPLRQFVARFTPHVPNPGVMGHDYRERREPSAQQTISPQEALESALRVFPDAQWVRVMMPTSHEPAYTIRMHQPGETRAWLGTTAVVVNSHDGQVLDSYDPLTAPLSNRFFDAIWSFHNGELFGLTGRIVAVLVGAALPLLYLTGLWKWLSRRKRKRAAVA